MQTSTQARSARRPAARAGRSSPGPASPRLRRFPARTWLLLFGAVVFAAGALGDLAFHALPPDLVLVVAPAVGADGYRAHLVTFAGMALVVAGLVLRGARR